MRGQVDMYEDVFWDDAQEQRAACKVEWQNRLDRLPGYWAGYLAAGAVNASSQMREMWDARGGDGGEKQDTRVRIMRGTTPLYWDGERGERREGKGKGKEKEKKELKKKHRKLTEPAKEGVEADVERYVAALEDKRRRMAAEPARPGGASSASRSDAATPGPSSQAGGSASQATSSDRPQLLVKIRAWKIDHFRRLYYKIERNSQTTMAM